MREVAERLTRLISWWSALPRRDHSMGPIPVVSRGVLQIDPRNLIPSHGTLLVAEGPWGISRVTLWRATIGCA